jgi:hypothetical protein
MISPLSFFEKKMFLDCSNESFSGNYSLFFYKDDPNYLTAYNNDVKKEHYIKTSVFLKTFLKQNEQIQQLEPLLHQQNS